MSGFRLEKGGRIDRTKPVKFHFDGNAKSGFSGDTLASALLADGQTLFGRSFKYHRPRGVMTAGSEEPNALVTVSRDHILEPNTRATMAEIYDGMVAKSQNRWPSLSLDILSANQLAGPLFQAGFYYKTFMGPTRKAWKLYEHVIRRAAGLGKAAQKHDTDTYEKTNAFADLLVVGGGIAGLTAALHSAKKGARVVLVDEHPELGGYHRGDPREDDAISSLFKELAAHPNATILRRTTCFGMYDDSAYGLVERVSAHQPYADEFAPFERYHVLRVKHAIFATGALERPLVFPGNDKPGVMLMDSIRAYALRYGVSTGKNIALFTSHDGAYAQLSALQDMGVPVKTVIDTRTQISDLAAAQVAATGLQLITGHAVTKVSGHQKINQISVTPFDPFTNSASGTAQTIECDCLGISGGWTPSIHLTSQMGGPPQWDETLNTVLPGASNGAWTACGTMSGHMNRDDVISSAQVAAEAVMRTLSFSKGRKVLKEPERVNTLNSAPVWKVKCEKGKSFVDFQHDVTESDIELAYREGFLSVEHLKRYTTLGMATDQGKLSNINGLALMAEARNMAIPDVGTTRFRPPYTPVSFGALVGDSRGLHRRPVRRTPMHDWHEKAGAEMMDAGPWKRPRVYRNGSETLEEAYVREARQTRRTVGIVDVSTLGKIAVQGPDASEFLNRVYSNPFAKLPVGKARYGLMLREDGIVYDDGTTWRLSETDFLMTTTTAHAGGVMEHLETYHALHWPDLKVHFTSVTDQWAAAAVAGPKARELLANVITDIDFSNEAFPFMAIRHGKTVQGIPVMLCRLSFSGELAFEIFTPSKFGLAVWKKLQAAGKYMDLVTYGMEALGTLRIEKGHVVGSELNGRTTAEMVGLGAMVSTKKSFVGSEMTDREGFNDTQRQQMVGLVSQNGEPVRIGSHLVMSADAKQPGISLGHVTSCAFSPALEKNIALALLQSGNTLKGQRLYATFPLKGYHVPVEVVETCFYDKDGERMHG
ncbi:MAG: sarcosine oxidase subunit alpha family protein [Hyphomicrobiales bacterium]